MQVEIKREMVRPNYTYSILYEMIVKTKTKLIKVFVLERERTLYKGTLSCYSQKHI